MAKAARIAKVDKKSAGTLVRVLTVVFGILCFGVLALALIHRLLPFLQILLPGMVTWWLWRRYRTGQDRQQKRLRTVFYRLLQEHHGQIMLLDFAMTAAIPAIAARKYLDSRAQEFAARFEVTEQGDVVYVFSSLQFSRLQAPEETLATAPTDSAKVLELPPSLTQTELAKRLGVAAKTISRKKHSPLLSDWTQARDPAGVGWSYVAQTQRFLPLSEPAQAEKAL
jgi:hypothetical protein